MYGQQVTLTATVTPSAATGSVTFYDGASSLGSETLSGGVATLQTSALAAGDHSLTAKYNGDTTYDSSTSDPVTQTVDKADTSVSVVSSVNPSVTGQSVTFTATVSAVSPGSGTPAGTVDFHVNGELSASNVALTAGQATHSRSFDHIEGPADIVVYYDGNANYNPSDNGLNPLTQTVNKAGTTTTITTAPVGPVELGGEFTVGGTVVANSPGSGTPTGTVVVSTGSGDSCASNLSGGAWSCSLASSAVGTTNLTAVYEGNESFAGSSATAPSFETAALGATVTVFVSDTPLVPGETATGTVSVQGSSGNFGAAPSGTVTLSHTGNGTLSPTSYALDPEDGGYFEFTYTPTDAALTPHVITATYVSDDGVYADGSDTFAQAIEKRACDVVMLLSTVIAYINQGVTVSICVEDDSTAGTPGTLSGQEVVLTTDGTGSFSDSSPTLGANGCCTVTYTPGPFEHLPTGAGTTTLTATFGTSSTVYEESSTTEMLAVELRPTEVTVDGCDNTILVNQGCTYTVTVTDVAEAGTPTNPLGLLAYSSYLGADATQAPPLGAAPVGTFVYTCIGLDAEAGIDTIYADYTAADGIHADSTGYFGQAIQRRPTVTTVDASCTTAGDVTWTATVTEDDDNAGGDTILAGDIHLLEPDETPCSAIFGATLTCTDTFNSGSPYINVSVRYEPTDRTHLGSTGSINLEREYAPDPGDDTTGANCDDGCGTGGVHITQILYNLNAAKVALEAVKLGLDTTALVLDVIPDGVITGGLIVQTGVTIPYSDIAKAIVAGAGIVLDVAILAMDVDLDGDGLPDVVEENTTHTSATDWDSDDDGMSDNDEVEEAGGYYGGSRRPNPNVFDSDGDGIGDGDEANLSHTDFCVADSDCDTVSDGVEYATWGSGQTEIRDQADPLMLDTDGDGLRDDIEIDAGCPYVNDDDSDDDGLQDGSESWDGDGTCVTGDIGDSSTQADLTGETDFCDPDTDGDGLTDGEEVALLGGLPVTGTGFTAVTPRGVSTVFGQEGLSLAATIPALDDDSDNDGLSDYEEVTITHTDPMDQDSDNDTLSDSNELIAVAGSSWPNRSFIQVSDPLDPDSDDDDLPDQVEYPGSGLGTSRASGGTPDNDCSYVDDDDSDDDGLQDGHEDLDKNGQFDLGTIGTTGTAGTGETDLCDPDTDGDGLDDGQEEWQLGAGLTNVTSQDGLAQTVPALDMDSDDDGLSDGEEVNVTHTDPLDWDTDNDTLSDLNELLVTGGTWPQRTFSQVSDPLDPDTDDDGLIDSVEYNGTGSDRFLHLSTDGTDDLVCTYVNDDDSDNDGLQDGAEDADHDGNWDQVTLGSIDTQAERLGDYWETDPCNPDTDGDGLLDGEEAALLGGGPISQRPATGWPGAETAPGFDTVTPEGISTVLPVGPNCDAAPMYTFSPTPGSALAITVPALDTDTDNDGLSDYEEVNITGTNPLDADSDNDTIADADELVATGGAWPQRTFDQESDPLDINTDDDGLFDPVEGECGDPIYTGTGLRTTFAGVLGGDRDTACPYVNNADSDNDAVMDGAVITLTPPGAIDGDGNPLQYTHCEGFTDVTPAGPDSPGVPRIVPEAGDGESYDDVICNVCDADSDGDGLTDGEEIGIGTNPDDWDTDNDGRSDWHEVTGGGPIPTDPFDPDTDDDGLLDSVEVFGSNTTNPTNADTDGDGLCDGGAGTPFMVSGDARVVVNPICKSCSTPGLVDCGTSSTRTGSPDGIGDHPNRFGFGEDQNGNGAWDGGETDPNQYDTDGDAIADGVERLAFSTSRANMIPPTDLFGRPILVTYPEANNVQDPCGCLDPLNPDSDGDGLSDGYEDANHDGNFDFLPSDFDIDTSSVETSLPDPEETNPCAADTDGDDLTDWEERFQRQPLLVNPPAPVDNDGDGLVDEDPVDGIDNDLDGRIDEDAPEGPYELTFNPTNPLDWDTDNDWLSDGYEVHYTCVAIEYTTLDNDTDGRIDEDPIDGLDNDEDGLFDEDPVDFWVRSIPMLDPTNRDSDSDGYIDGLDEDPCNSELIPIVETPILEPVDSDGDGFSDDDEIAAGTHPNSPDDHPTAYCAVDVDFDDAIDDRIWLEPGACCGEAGSVVFDLDANVLIDLRVTITSKSIARGDFDKDGYEDDIRYTVEYILSNYRTVQLHGVATIDDFNCDLVIDWVVVQKK
ncbi:MAG: Ig-like domain repeat protein [Thermotogota bacterium]